MSSTKTKGTPSLHRGKKEPGKVQRLFNGRIWRFVGFFETKERAEAAIREYAERQVPKSYYKIVRHSEVKGVQYAKTWKGFMALIKRSFVDGHRPCACGKR